ncbi:hypothetical protein SAMN03080610_03380 [Afifella marina DSM 2698]|uniref:Uncharacterized protein n=1 Tax=Afifella marina DSM 2698 TaxID=1120955 RepID=A0A1G5P818_AFIMA|nr:hypothetical protein SAMN03080610_03380 [Afifella marina DSM 2698]
MQFLAQLAHSRIFTLAGDAELGRLRSGRFASRLRLRPLLHVALWWCCFRLWRDGCLGGRFRGPLPPFVRLFLLPMQEFRSWPCFLPARICLTRRPFASWWRGSGSFWACRFCTLRCGLGCGFTRRLGLSLRRLLRGLLRPFGPRCRRCRLHWARTLRRPLGLVRLRLRSLLWRRAGLSELWTFAVLLALLLTLAVAASRADVGRPVGLSRLRKEGRALHAGSAGGGGVGERQSERRRREYGCKSHRPIRVPSPLGHG